MRLKVLQIEPQRFYGRCAAWARNTSCNRLVFRKLGVNLCPVASRSFTSRRPAGISTSQLTRNLSTSDLYGNSSSKSCPRHDFALSCLPFADLTVHCSSFDLWQWLL